MHSSSFIFLACLCLLILLTIVVLVHFPYKICGHILFVIYIDLEGGCIGVILLSKAKSIPDVYTVCTGRVIL